MLQTRKQTGQTIYISFILTYLNNTACYRVYYHSNSPTTKQKKKIYFGVSKFSVFGVYRIWIRVLQKKKKENTIYLVIYIFHFPLRCPPHVCQYFYAKWNRFVLWRAHKNISSSCICRVDVVFMVFFSFWGTYTEKTSQSYSFSYTNATHTHKFGPVPPQ